MCMCMPNDLCIGDFGRKLFDGHSLWLIDMKYESNTIVGILYVDRGDRELYYC